MQYSGQDNLEVMSGAKNYNHWLLAEVLRNMTPHAERIVDFGAGDGGFARALQAKSAGSIICIEPADNLRRQLQGLQHAADISEISGELDYIYSLNVLEHIEDDAEILRLWYQRLKISGKVFIYVPAFPMLYSAMDKHVGHYRRYRRAELINKAQTAGFTVTECRYADFAGWFASWWLKLCGRTDGSLSPRMVSFYDRIIFPLSRGLDILTGGRLLGKNLILIAEKSHD